MQRGVEYEAKVIRKNKKDPRYLAYAFGFICHFALDATCHGYIDDKIAESGISHVEIEVEVGLPTLFYKLCEKNWQYKSISVKIVSVTGDDNYEMKK